MSSLPGPRGEVGTPHSEISSAAPTPAPTAGGHPAIPRPRRYPNQLSESRAPAPGARRWPGSHALRGPSDAPKPSSKAFPRCQTPQDTEARSAKGPRKTPPPSARNSLRPNLRESRVGRGPQPLGKAGLAAGPALPVPSGAASGEEKAARVAVRASCPQQKARNSRLPPRLPETVVSVQKWKRNQLSE